MCKAVPRSLCWVPNGFNELPTVLLKFPLQPDYSGGSWGGAHPPPPLFLDQTEAQRAKKILLGDRAPPLPPPPYLRVWMTGPPAYLNVWIRHWISQLNHGFFYQAKSGADSNPGTWLGLRTRISAPAHRWT